MKRSGFKKWSITAVLLVLICGLFIGCGNESAGNDDSDKADAGTYTVEVVTEGGKALEDIGIFVYTDESQSELDAAGETDDDGVFTFESEGSINSVIVLKDVPRGYQLDETYVIKDKNTKIVLQAQLLAQDEIADVTFKLGDVFVDMSVVAVDGNTYTISQLLEEKQAVVLNFWYLNCGPCKMEFPFLEESYVKYKDKIEVLALNPVDGTKETVAQFQEENKLSFPMAACDAGWEKKMNLSAYPTTIVIDRYGTIAFMHSGSITETAVFDQIFECFTADDYKQVAVRNLKDLK